MNGTQLSLVAIIRAKRGLGDELGRPLVAAARAEPGNINYDLHRSNDDPDVWILYENWKACSDLAFRIALHESIPSGVARGARRRNGFEAFFDGHEDRRKGLVPL